MIDLAWFWLGFSTTRKTNMNFNDSLRETMKKFNSLFKKHRLTEADINKQWAFLHCLGGHDVSSPHFYDIEVRFFEETTSWQKQENWAIVICYKFVWSGKISCPLSTPFSDVFFFEGVPAFPFSRFKLIFESLNEWPGFICWAFTRITREFWHEKKTIWSEFAARGSSSFHICKTVLL